MKKLVNIMIALVAVVGLASMVPAATVSADAAQDALNGVNAAGGDTDTRTVEGSFRNIVNVLLFVIGAVAVIMIIVGGLRYTTANGDTSAITSAKNTILYAVIGLVVAIMAYAIVNFVIASFR